MGQIAAVAGNTADAASYAAQAQQFVAYWACLLYTSCSPASTRLTFMVDIAA